ncbi:unnamed protein product, partial [Soboliphyme baturini]|uniref:Uncharacterized protein n=1 Tax=Soboliphyme baturini TaxID=241478 RepID=A0A183J4Y2_9BILA
MQCSSPSEECPVRPAPPPPPQSSSDDLCSACSSPEKLHQSSEFDIAVGDSQKRSSSVGDMPKSKRKQYHPHQVELGTAVSRPADTRHKRRSHGNVAPAAEEVNPGSDLSLNLNDHQQASRTNGDNQINDQLKQIRRELFLLQRRYIEMLTEHQKKIQLPDGGGSLASEP